MGNFYIDDSVHDDAGFILCACVYAPSDVEHVVVELMKSADLIQKILNIKVLLAFQSNLN
jgi:hypothetical protein